MGERRQARERALALLYEAEMRSQSAGAVVDALPVPAAEYAVRLVEGVVGRRDEIDKLIESHAVGWGLDRMPAIDRNLLRLATYELIAEPAIPVAVVIDEAVELAKSYSTEESSRYVNGVLSAVASEVR